MLIIIKVWLHHQSLHSLSERTSYRKISWGLEATRCFNDGIGLKFACQISERSEKSKLESRGFETSRDLAVRRLTA